MFRQGLENLSDVYLGSARDVNMEVWEAQFDKLLDDSEHFCPVRHQTGGIRGFIHGIDDDVECALPWKSEHVLQTLRERFLTGLSEAISVGRIKIGENFSEMIGFIAQLDDNRRQKVPGILFRGVPEIKIEVCEGSQSSVTQDLDVFDDR